MASVSTREPHRFVRGARKIYHPVGFKKGYNAILFIVFAGALLGFILARLQYLSFSGIFCNGQASTISGAAPGECYWYSMPRYYVGIMLHLSTILPAGLLAILQFVPAIRHRAILYHRIAGHVIILLVIVSMVGVFMIQQIAFGGGLDVQGMVGVLGIASLVSLAISYYNIRRKQIDQHRAWMLRAWFYMGSIITLRLIFFITALIITNYGTGYYTVQPCAKLISAAGGNASQIYAEYPPCAPGNANMTVDQHVVVKANLNGSVSTAMSSLNIGFGMAGSMAFFIHAVGVEIYLWMTPREAARLRQVSYQRQLDAGFKNPGSAGLVAERFGDADPWQPPIVTEVERHVPKGVDARPEMSE